MVFPRARRLLFGLALLGHVLVVDAASIHGALRISRNFRPQITRSYGASLSGVVAAPMSHGGYYLFGTFTAAGGRSGYGIARFHADGTADDAFIAPELFLSVDEISGHHLARVAAAAVQPDGKPLAVYFGRLTPQSAFGTYLARLHVDGSLDSGFAAALLDSNSVTDVLVQSDGKIVAAGGFYTVNQVSRPRLVRFAPDGSVDATFAPGPITDVIMGVAGTADGRLYVGTAMHVRRLLADGAEDPSFLVSFGAAVSGQLDLAVQPDGKLIVAGRFSAIGGAQAGSIARFHPDGTRDDTFTVGTGFTTQNQSPAEVGRVVVEPDGKIVVMTDAYFLNGGRVGQLVRLHPDGAHDMSFASSLPGLNLSNSTPIRGLIRLADGEFVAAASSAAWMAATNGAVDASVQLTPALPSDADVVARTHDGRWLIGSSYRFLVQHTRLARVNADGSMDEMFQPTLDDAPFEVSSIAVTPEGNALVATRVLWSGPKGILTSKLVRVGVDGVVDPTFDVTAGLAVPANLSLDHLGRVVVWGGPTSLQINPSLPTIVTKSLARLNSNGSTDASFSPNDSITLRNVLALGLQSNGRVVLSLAATDSENARFLRLNTNGSSDGSFNTGSGFDGEVRALAIQPDDRIIVAGNFNSYRGETVAGIARILSNGSRDTTFSPGTGFDRAPAKVGVLSDGKILFSGDFSSYRGTFVRGLARVNSDGSLDTSFTINGDRTALASVTSWAEGSDGALLVVAPGQWTSGLDVNSAGVVLLEPAAKPQITVQPIACTVTAGAAATLSVTAESSEPLSYQWQLDGVNIPGATSATLALPSAQGFHAGQYAVVVSASGFSVTSRAVTLGVTTPAPSTSQLVNLSTRAVCLTGDGVLVPGFVVEGTASRRLMLRAVGPTLGQAPFNLAGVLSNPRLALKRRSATGVFEDIASNDDWSSNANAGDILAAAARLSAFPLNDAREAALLLEVPAGQYTVIADDAGGATGTAIVEVYDAQEADTDARLINLSNRGFAGRGEQVMIPGFVVSSDGPKTLLLRVVGPTLAVAPFTISGAMSDPGMSVYRTESDGSSTLLFRNDDWMDMPDAAQTAAVAEQVFAFPLVADSRDAALVVTLGPGVYTVHGAASDGVSTGVVLVELYVVR